MNIGDLPVEIQNKIFYFSAQHPLSTLLKKHIKVHGSFEPDEHYFMLSIINKGKNKRRFVYNTNGSDII